MEMAATVARLRNNLARVILGKGEVIEQVLVALLADGNVLLEDVPGVGKTTLAKAVARSVDAVFHRIQFTPDLLPADILGGSIFNPQTGEFSFRPGPVFCNILLADEINRASPRTQSALLEAMTENQVTVEGESHPLPPPFMVIATENPIEYHGTYPLPEAQLDRFILEIALGYPESDDELAILYGQQHAHPLVTLEPVITCDDLRAMQQQVRQIGVEESVARYLLALVRATRSHPQLRLGASPRASLMLFRAAQAQALIRGRSFVVPDDVRDLAVPVLSHRVVVDTQARYAGLDRREVLKSVVASVPVPP